jgi:Flp pilus assembly protein TadG
MNVLGKFPILSRFVREDRGQTLAFTAAIITAFVGVTGLAVDAGKGYWAYQMLKAGTDAAALAGAAGMPNTTTATTYATNYGSKTSERNAVGVMNSVVETITFGCSATVTSDFSTPCENATGGYSGTTYNTIQVNQTAKVPTWIGPLFGMPTFNISATSTASMNGGAPKPYNIAVVLDTTESMTGPDDGLNSNCSSQIQCAEQGIQTLLTMAVPGTSTTPVDEVALFVFPAVTTGTVSDDYNCGNTNPTIVPYDFQNVATGSSQNLNLPSGGTYEIVPFTNNYQTASGGLNTAANMVLAVGGGGCSGMQAPGGEGTYYAQVIYYAQAALVAEAAINKNPNVMIILSDGDATACNTAQATTGGTSTTNTCHGSSQITSASGTLNGTGTSTSNAGSCTTNPTYCTGYHSYYYPSALGECGQAVQAAQAASAAGTTVYTIGYDSESSGCTTDANYSFSTTTTGSTGGYGANTWAAGGSPCAALGAMATNAGDFLSDNYEGHCPAVDASYLDFTSIKQEFHVVSSRLTTARLIPNGNLDS